MQLKGRHVLGFAAVASAVVLVALTSTGVAIGARISKALSSRSVPVGLGHAVKPDNLEKQAQTTFRYTLANKMDEDGVFFHFCGGTPDMLPWATWYSDAALSKPLRGDPAHDGEISDTYGEATKFNWAECATSGLMFFEVAKNASITIYAPSDTMYLPSGKVWWVPKSLLGPGGPGRALAKGPDQMSSSEMTWCAQPHASTPFPPKCGDGAGGGCSASGAPGILNGDVSGVDGYSYGSTLVFTPDSPGQENLSAKCIAATGPVGVEAEQTKYGFYSITAQGKSYGTCSTTPCPAGDDSCHFCGEFSEDPSSPCMSDACLGQCPATIANNACGQHHCRKWHKNYDNYDIWVKKACPGSYGWAMGELDCVDKTCGWGGADQPATCADVASFDTGRDWIVYSCGKEANQPSNVPGTNWWTSGPQCFPTPADPQINYSPGEMKLTVINSPFIPAPGPPGPIKGVCKYPNPAGIIPTCSAPNQCCPGPPGGTSCPCPGYDTPPGTCGMDSC